MHSIFSRSRTNSTPKKLSLKLDSTGAEALDEFGRVSSRTSNNGAAGVYSSKKDKKKTKEQDKRLRTGSSARDDEREEAQGPSIPDGSFLPLNLERPRDEAGVMDEPKEHDYGYLAYERHVVLGLEQVERLVDVVTEELSTRGGLTTPFIFSSLALDISSTGIKRLIRTFLNTCGVNPGRAAGEAEKKWQEEARFAGLHELGMCLRWGLARLVRTVGGQDVRGLIAWEHYVEFRDSEAALNYPPTHFATFLPELVPPLRSILLKVLSLLTRLTAHSASSGHTPPSLSPLFGPLLFGLGPATLAFHHTYLHYLRAVNATEHILLAFIRWQDSPRPASSFASPSAESTAYGSAATLGVPTRLKDWIRGYPAMLPFLQHERAKNEKPQARRGARTVRVLSVRRNVRMYSPDLVKSASTWAARRPGAAATERGFATSKEWERIAPATLKLAARYSDGYRKRMDMPPGFEPDSGIGAAVSLGRATGVYSVPSASSSTASSSLLEDKDYFGVGRAGEDRFRSLTDLKWGEFESMGFGGLGTDSEKKLQFDLTEGARTARAAKRATLSWNDFSTAGFTRTDVPLNATLQFSTPVANSISSWPAQNAEMTKKLKKSQKALPAFGWDTEPVMGGEEVVEEAFLDVFCDLIYGGGWMDLERSEELDRECNWALIEFKSLPPSRTTASGGSDPRTATSILLFEEFVPLEYRQQLAESTSTRKRLPSLFSPSTKSKQWKQAPTLNGRPYVVGHVPKSPSYREVEFEGLLRGQTGTKVISLNAKGSPQLPSPLPPLKSASSGGTPLAPVTSRTLGISSPLYTSPRTESPQSKSEDFHSDSTMSPSKTKGPRFRLPGGIPVPSPGGSRKAGVTPSEYSSVDFETRLASYSDDEHNSARDGAPEPEDEKQRRRESKSDAWVDILVSTHARRLGEQDAEPRKGGRAVHARRSDPELASLEVAQVLAAVRDRSASPASNDGRLVPDFGLNDLREPSVDEIETVPRASNSRTTSAVNSVILAYDEEEGAEADDEPDEPEEPEEPDDYLFTAQQQMERRQKRLGYFDLHPERRPRTETALDDDPRSRLQEDSEDEAEDHRVYGEPESLAPPMVPPKTYSPQRKLDVLPDRPAYVTQFDDADEPRVVDRDKIPPRSDSIVSPLNPPPPLGSPPGNGNGHGIAIGNGLGKTAALIEMYREKERERTLPVKPLPVPKPLTPPKPLASPVPTPPLAPVAPLAPLVPATHLAPLVPATPLAPPLPPIPTAQPSRLPVRAPIPRDGGVLPLPAVAPLVITKPAPKAPSPDILLPEPPRITVEDTGRASPMRYVHGAPLHNVLEEEEEEA